MKWGKVLYYLPSTASDAVEHGTYSLKTKPRPPKPHDPNSAFTHAPSTQASYKLIQPRPPQICAPSPAHESRHPARLATVVPGTLVSASVFPHQHSRRYSEPANRNPRPRQKATQTSFVSPSSACSAPPSVRPRPSPAGPSSGAHPTNRQPRAVTSRKGAGAAVADGTTGGPAVVVVVVIAVGAGGTSRVSARTTGMQGREGSWAGFCGGE